MLGHLLRKVAINAAGPVVGGVHSRTRHGFVAIEQVFALTERIQKHRHRADIQAMRANPHQVIEHPRDFVEQYADVLRPDRYLKAEQLFNRQHIGVLIAHHRDIVEPVHVRQVLNIGTRFGQLFSGTMQ